MYIEFTRPFRNATYTIEEFRTLSIDMLTDMTYLMVIECDGDVKAAANLLHDWLESQHVNIIDWFVKLHTFTRDQSTYRLGILLDAFKPYREQVKEGRSPILQGKRQLTLNILLYALTGIPEIQVLGTTQTIPSDLHLITFAINMTPEQLKDDNLEIFFQNSYVSDEVIAYVRLGAAPKLKLYYRS